ncbi:pentatricopeptide repeat-containing protein At2g45350, chloroplastic-like [Magnolia sinica]|uniref:pentatricopeptide repeat-containing protein At2g45350, chloroplastic-like n=1 Tax=Magnolia sinica TaxID=86752 RepID=UPI00265A34DD|nr:pentatricopeptide repeat-containing protein At2g45350, chloroplastic-like [Magnolia sinica]
MNGSLSSLLYSCRSLKSLKSIHARLLIEGSIASSDVVLSRILRSYGRLCAVDHARKLFDQILQPNAFLWTALIYAHVENCLHEDALLLFRRMRMESMPPLNFTLSLVIKALARQLRLRDGQSIHGLVFKLGLESDSTVQNSVLDLYSRCRDVDVARRVFDGMHCRDIVSWNCMISGYCNNSRIDVAHGLFDRMPERNVVSWTAMISGYVAAGNITAAHALFEQMPVRDSASWNALIAGYMNAGDAKAACRVFEEMPKRDIGSWNMMISGLCKAGELHLARDMFDRMPAKSVVSWTMMVDGYIRTGDVEHARCLFDQMPEKNVVSWSTMIAGYAKHGQPNNALKLFERFKETGIKPDETFILVIISTCSQVGLLDTAEGIVHEYIEHSQLSNPRLDASLIDMYAKCGSVGKALQVFEHAHRKDLVCYSAMITAFSNHGMCQDAINLLNEMLQANIRPDGVAFIGLLSACSHAGLIDEGKRCFKLMTEDFSIQPSERHYACMVDLLSRAGFLEEAHKLIRDMPIKPHSAVWGALLAACRVHCNVELAEVAAGCLFEIEPDNSGNYILLSNVYAAAKRWDDVARVRTMIRQHGVRKNRGSSWIELDCVVHEFVMGDMSRFDYNRIHAVLDLLLEEMKNFGYGLESNHIIQW